MSYIDPSLGDLEQPTPNGPAQLVYPFIREGDVTSFIIRQTVRVLGRFYKPTEPRTPFEPERINRDSILLPDTNTDVFLIEETEPIHIGNQIYEWEQIWGVVPEPRVEPSLVSWTLPGIESETSEATATITGNGYSLNVDTNQYNIYLNLNDATGFETGDFITFTVSIISYFNLNAFVSQRRTVQTNIVGVTGNRLFLPYNNTTRFLYVSDPNYLFTFIRNLIRRSPRAVTILSSEQIEYLYLESPEQFIPSPEWTIFGANSTVTDTLTPTTVPSSADYLEYIADGENLQAQAPSMQRWRGNIWEVRTPYVRAQ